MSLGRLLYFAVTVQPKHIESRKHACMILQMNMLPGWNDALSCVINT